MKRRELFQTLGAAGLIGLTTRRTAKADETTPEPGCILTPQQTEGPFYFDTEQVRKNIAEGRPGEPLRLRLTVVEASACEPIPDAVVDVWHADAAGIYSGYARQGDRRRIDASQDDFMRGVQVTDELGRVEFETIYPGWYRGRTTHIHFKVHLDNRTAVTSQLYFPDAVTAEIYTRPPYHERGQNPTTNARDGVLRRGQLESLMARVAKDEEANNGYIALHVIGVA